MNKQAVGIAVLAILVVVSAFITVGVKHLNRMHFMEIQSLLDERDELRIEWEWLQLGVDSFGTLSRVENFAEKNLNMVVPTHDQVISVVIYE